VQAREQAASAAAERRRAALQRLAASVAPAVDSDPDRLLQPIASGTADAEVQGTAFRSVHGYTAEQVVRDPRFRVLEALAAAGPAARGRTAAAGDVLAGLAAAPRHMMTSEQRERSLPGG
jgi:hypothetical protein